MATFATIVLAALILFVFYFISLYNSLVSLTNGVKKSWSNIDVLLKQRHDELPKLVETCKQYMAYEKDTLEKIVQARAASMQASQTGDVAQISKAETQLRNSLGGLFAVAENYPELKAADSFQHLQKRLSDLENTIADRRELYNEQVNLNNTRIEQFPDIIVAKMFNFKAADLLVFTQDEIKDVDMKALF